MIGVVDRVLDKARLRRAPGRPKQVHLAVTDRCFLPCVHCDIWKNKTPDLDGAIWADFIDRLGEWCAPAGMNFVGGEPLLRKDLEQLMGRAVRNGFEVSFNTNGWLVSEKRAQAISQAGVSVGYVSLDGINEKTIDHSRGRVGSFKKAMEAIDLLDALPNPRVVIAAILHGENAGEMSGLLEFVRDRNLQLVVQPLYQNFGDNTYDPKWHESTALWPRTNAALASIDAAIELLVAERMKGGAVCNPVGQLAAFSQHFRSPGIDNGHQCRAGHSDLSIDAHGNVRMCYFLEPVATIFDNSPLPLVWDGVTTLRRRWEVSRCDRACNLLNCNFERVGL
jgi:MoaA/NifB/PqqE/SkfB family radical SAM enzyme